MKTCTKCGEDKAETGFYRAKDSYCRECKKADARAWAKANPEKARARYDRWAAKHPDRIRGHAAAYRARLGDEYKIRMKKWYGGNKERVRENSRRWVAKNRERALANDRAKRERNPEGYAAMQRDYAIRNAEKISQYKKEWRTKNKHLVNKVAARRQANKMSATPAWLSAIHHAQIDEMYDIAIALTTQTGIKHHVDHIHPLRGKNFRGLHVPWNLQVLTARENMEKNDRPPLPHQHVAFGDING